MKVTKRALHTALSIYRKVLPFMYIIKEWYSSPSSDINSIYKALVELFCILLYFSSILSTQFEIEGPRLGGIYLATDR